MNWARQIDGYCERMDLTFWAEPVNAVTNLTFLIAAVIMWRRTAGLPAARVLCVILFAIGVGSFLFHTFATIWASTADVVPIGLFVLTYIYLANRSYFGLRPLWAVGATVLFFPFAALIVPVFQAIGLGSSSGYAPVALLIFIYALALRSKLPQVSNGLLLGAAILCVSLTARTIDEPLCVAVPLGTHFLWHCLNGIMLSWMIEVYRRHVLRTAQA
ncbi:ceramidase domain-containing protein [Litoreibacter roseus]|uniref:Membrane protein n=1 Tax=Litoreibacter roseus TaxID=2601869 RepID=A0A6N6JH14_9RHOB|nr:ceramidase domain-containing protein [Litoreibacter roseus]GFE65611.1 membrane protein [Litoreibacter roseus]